MAAEPGMFALALAQAATKREPTKDEKRRAYLTQKNREWRERKRAAQRAQATPNAKLTRGAEALGESDGCRPAR